LLLPPHPTCVVSLAQRGDHEGVPAVDLDKKGKISFANLKEVARMLGENPGDDVLMEMI